MGRNLERYKVEGEKNAMHYFPQIVGLGRASWNFTVITVARYVPWIEVKNRLYRLVGMKVGRHVSVGLMAMMDIFFPHLITIGDNSIIGYNATILTHEFLIDEWRRGPVTIGKNVLIGANCTILAGVTVGDGATVAAHSLVNSNVPPGSFYGGVPARELKTSRS